MGPSVDVVSFVPKIMGDITVIQSLKIAYNGILKKLSPNQKQDRKSTSTYDHI